VPCVTLRDETEWVETVAAGWNTLTGSDRDRIVEAARIFAPPAAHPPLYGDGRTAVQCVSILERTSQLAHQPGRPELAGARLTPSLSGAAALEKEG
jgi:UDP-N-acetylglucosamine 2-epimerase